MPHPGHCLTRAIKDLFPRYRTMRGYFCERKAGWDTHGLPIELQVEKELGITKDDIGKKISVEDYNQKCREAVMRFTDVWQDMTDKMGYWVDMNDPYITYKNEYIESLWYLLKQLYDKDLLYKGYTIQPYSPAAGTGSAPPRTRRHADRAARRARGSRPAVARARAHRIRGRHGVGRQPVHAGAIQRRAL